MSIPPVLGALCADRSLSAPRVFDAFDMTIAVSFLAKAPSKEITDESDAIAVQERD